MQLKSINFIIYMELINMKNIVNTLIIDVD